ncbi:aldose 1-epimerase family protein [Clostridium sp. DL1XJH146]
MVYEMKNPYLKVIIDSKGAELISLKTVKDNLQYIWSGDPLYWKRHAPVLFPIVGKVNNDRYKINGLEYELPQHGFARDMEFKLEDSGEQYVEYSLSSNEETIEKYPYKFKLYIRYELLDEGLKISYKVENKDNGAIYFSVGAHPAFNCPLLSDEKFSDYYLEFSEIENEGIYPFEEGYIVGEKIPFLKEQKILQLSQKLLEDGALIFENLKSSRITLKSYKNDRYIMVDYEGFPYLGIWSKEDGASFICIEPWYGIADLKGYEGDFKDKQGIIEVLQNEIFECNYSFQIK